MADISSVQSVERTFLLLELLAKNGRMGVTALAQASDLNKTTVFRLLLTLSRLGYVRKTGGEQYEITLSLLRIAGSALSQIDMRRYARPYLEPLPKEIGETVHLVERSGNDIIYIDKYESALNSVRMASRVGLSLPMVYTAVGKAILSHLSNEEIIRIFRESDVRARTPATIVTLPRFLSEIEEVRRRGYACDREENESGVVCVAAAFPDATGDFRYAVSVSAPASRMPEEKIPTVGEIVTRATKKISGMTPD